jgi:O-antigen/teichoic acid export membrane protein
VTVERAAKAGAWSAIDILLRQTVSFAVLLVLARLLTPADFGLVALVTFFSNLSIVFVQGGLTQALIQRADTSAEEEGAIFWWNLGGSGLCALVLIATGPFLAAFYGYPLLAPLMAVGAAQVLLTALGAVHTALLTRALRFDRLTLAGIAASLVSAAVGIGAALAGAGAWALALQLVTMAAVNSALLWVVSDWRPALHFRFGTIRKLFRSGIYLSLSGALDVAYSQGFALIIGKIYGVGDLGLYNRAHSTQALPSGVMGVVVGRTALPLFVARIEDADGLRRGLRMANSVSMIINVPAMIGLALLSELVIVTLFGEQWRGAAPILAVLALSGILLPMHIINLQLMLARVQSARFFRIELLKRVIGIAFVAVGSFFGIMGLAWSTAALSLLALWINSAAAKETLGYTPLRQLWDLRGLTVPVAAMAAAVFLLEPVLGGSEPVRLLLLATGGAAVYFAVGFGLSFHDFLQARSIAVSVLRGKRVPIREDGSGPPPNLL